MEYYSVIKQEEILPFGTIWTELEGITLSEISQRERETQRLTCLTYMWNLGGKEPSLLDTESRQRWGMGYG